MAIRIGNGAGFLGDSLDAPRRLVESAELDYLTLEYLAELTLSILARSRVKDPQLGLCRRFYRRARRNLALAGLLTRQPRLKIVTNAGGMNPGSCVRRAAELLAAAGLGTQRVALVTGDDLLGRLGELQAAGCKLRAHLDTRVPLADLAEPVVSANAYLGARPIAEALDQSARIVVTGRVADASLTLGGRPFTSSRLGLGRLAPAGRRPAVAGHLDRNAAPRLLAAFIRTGTNSTWPTWAIRLPNWSPTPVSSSPSPREPAAS